ncbi:MAG: tetratricopeptide repeat protein, partial [Gemmataceae bacterium]
MVSIRWLCVATSVFLLSARADAEDFARQGQQALERNDPNQAIACFSKAIQANPKDAASYRGRGDAYL